MCNLDLQEETDGYWNLVFPRLLQSKIHLYDPIPREREKALDALTKGMQLLAEMEAVWG